LGARPLTEAIEALALQTHLALPVTEPERSKSSSSPSGLSVTASLTTREQEVLQGLLAGETYAQIAHRLFISDKTVSSHVTNILRKTGTTSRIELSVLARRDSGTP
jgi:DNA-binding NarL/FixJ family response regulator